MKKYFSSLVLIMFIMGIIGVQQIGFDSIAASETQNNNIVLTEQSPNITIESGRDVRVYGSSGINQITLESGAKAKLFYCVGSDIIKFQSNSSMFKVSRSGATVYFKGNDNTFLSIPATRTSQNIVFADGMKKKLIIDLNNVTIGGQIITNDPAPISIPWGTFFHCEGQSIVADSTKEKVLLRGVNLPGLEYGHFSCSYYPNPGVVDYAYFQPIESDFEKIRDWGFNVIRVPFEWARLVPGVQENSLLPNELDTTFINTYYLQQLKEIITLAAQYHLYVILDMHSYFKYWDAQCSFKCVDDNNYYQDLLKKTWRFIAAHFKNDTTVFGYEIMNEPYSKDSCTDSNWHTVAQEITNSIREVDENHILLINGRNYSNSYSWEEENTSKAFVTDPIDPPRVVYAPHTYFASDKWNITKYINEEEVPNNYWEYYLRDRVYNTLGWAWANRNDVPLFYTEIGIPNTEEWAEVMDRAFTQYFDPAKVSVTYWQYNTQNESDDINRLITEDKTYQLNVLKQHLGKTYESLASPENIPNNSLIYKDAMILDWTKDSFNKPGDIFSFDNKEPVYGEGGSSIAIKFVDDWGGVIFRNSSFDTKRYKYLRFCIHGGTEGKQNIRIYTEKTIWDPATKKDITTTNKHKELKDYIVPEADKWICVQIPLQDLVDSSDSIITSINFQNIGDPQERFYIDEVELLPCTIE